MHLISHDRGNLLPDTLHGLFVADEQATAGTWMSAT